MLLTQVLVYVSSAQKNNNNNNNNNNNSVHASSTSREQSRGALSTGSTATILALSLR